MTAEMLPAAGTERTQDPGRFWAPWSLRALVEERDALSPSPSPSAGAALTRAAARTRAVDGELHCWVTRFEPVPDGPDEAGRAAGALAGVPLGVKDIIDVAGHPTRCGSTLRDDAGPAEHDAAVVRAWRGTGAVPVGKTVTTEFAYFAPGPTRNPADLRRTPGGSSSGSAAAVASGQVPLALGSQTAGSLTRPAAYCGVASLVMTPGTLPSDGVVGLSPTFDSHGFVTATVGDLALAWSALRGAEDVVGRAWRAPRLLWCDGVELAPVAPEVRRALDAVRRTVLAAGGRCDELPRGIVGPLAEAHACVMAAEAAAERRHEREHLDALSEPLARLLQRGAATADDELDGARRVLHAGRATLGRLLQEHDAVIAPAAPSTAPLGILATGDPVLIRPWQALGLPTVGVPGLRSPDGLPLGLQLVGAAGDETELLATAVWLERLVAGGLDG